ncbi:MAG: hypothetical protein AB4042_21975 [Leptolyngbyaceae cyanobacterium]
MSANDLQQNRILEPERSYTFRNYFDMIHEPDEILAEFGVGLQRTHFEWPESTRLQEYEAAITHLKQDIQRRLPYVSLTSKAARREVLIAPVLLTLVDYTQAQLRIEYSLNVSDQLKGTLDYYLHGGQAQSPLLVIEAKQAALDRTVRLYSQPGALSIHPDSSCICLSQNQK